MDALARRLEAEAASEADDGGYYDDDGGLDEDDDEEELADMEDDEEEDDEELADMEDDDDGDDGDDGGEDEDELDDDALDDASEAAGETKVAGVHRGAAPRRGPRRGARPSRAATARVATAPMVASVVPVPHKPGHMQAWDIHNFKRLHAGKRVCIIGGTTCGKTTALYEIVGAMHRNEKLREVHKAQKERERGKPYKAKRGGIQFAIGFSKTENANGNLGGPVRNDDGDVVHKYSLMPSFCATHGFEEQRLADFMQYQIDTKSYGKMKTSLVIMDDVMSQKGVKNSPVLNEFMQNARNYGCGLIQGQHSVKQSSVDSRTQFHYVVCYEIGADQMKAFYDVFASRVFPTFRKFRETWMTMNRKLGQYWALVIDIQNSANSSRIEDRVFKFKARNPDRDDFKIPHVCELGCWWIDRNLSKATKSQTSLRDLFDLAHIAHQQGISLGQPAQPMGEADGMQDEAPGNESVLFSGGVAGGTVLEPAHSSFDLRV